MQAQKIIEEAEPDIVVDLLAHVAAMHPGLTRDALAKIEKQLRGKYGGQRVHIHKRGKHLTPDQRSAIFKDGLTAMPNAEITQKHKISRATLYRQMKKGGRFDEY